MITYKIINNIKGVFKMNKLKLTIILSILMIVLIACSSDSTEKAEGNDDGVKIRIGHPGNDTEVDPYHSYTNKFEEVLEEKTDGRIKIEVFPNNQLGDLESMMEQVDNGDLEMTAGQNAGTLATYDDNIQVLDLPYAFETLDIGKEVLDGEFGNKLKDSVYEKSGLQLMSFLPSSFRHFGNNKHKISSPEDLEGLTMRTMEIPVHQEMMKSLGAIPQTIAFEELYSATQTGVVDGHEQAPYTMLMENLQEVTDYFSLDKHVMNTAVTLVNQDFFNNLNEEDQNIIIEAENEAANALLEHVADNNEKDLEEIKDAGVEINELSSEEFEKFQDVVIEPVSEYLNTRVDEGLIDDMLQAIEEAS